MGVVLSSILYQPSEGRLSFLCPACNTEHMVTLTSDAGKGGWTWNHDIVEPSFDPSIVVKRSSEELCHSWITNGKIRYFEDSTHLLAGKTMPLIPHRHKL